MRNKRTQTYIVTKPFETPEVYNTGSSHQQAQVGFKRFRKGEIIRGELKTSNGKPAFVLVGRMTIVPLGNIKKLVTKSIVRKGSAMSGVDGEKHREYHKPTLSEKYTAKSNVTKIKYLDAVLIGGAVGGLGFWLAEKKGFITSTNPKNKLYAAIGGAVLTFYAVYRYQQSKAKKSKVRKPKYNE